MTAPLRRSALFLAVAALVAVAGCERNAPQQPEPAAKPEPASAPAKPMLGSFGFDAGGMDRSVAAGDNFFDFANGEWVKRTEIPADRSAYGSFNLLADKAEADTRAIMEGAAKDAQAGGEVKKIGDYYTAFMDEAGIEAKGLAPIQPQLEAFGKIADAAALSREFGAQLRTDVDVLNMTDYYTDRLLGLWITQDIHQPDRYVPYLLQGGLGMPDRSYYLDGGKAAELRKQYQAHVAKVLTLAGVQDAEAKAGRILALETAIARVHASQEQTNDVQRGAANIWKQADFAAKAPGIDWAAFFDAAGLKGQQDFVVWQPEAVIGIAKLVASQPLDTWKDYLAFHALDRASAHLPKAFADEQFAFYGTTLMGTPQQRPRWKRAVAETNASLGEAVGKLYVKDHFTPETKARAEEMVKNIIAAFGRRIDALEWMAPETKAHAKTKLNGLRVALGYPEKWHDYSSLEVKRDDALGNAERAGLFEYRRNLAKLGTPVTHDEFYMVPQTVNALNVPLENRLAFPAAILQPPFFDPAADDAVNYGAIGAVIGHEISHSFDNNGAQFDENGKLHNWWTEADLKRFDAAGDALAAQYDTYKPFPDVSVNGKLTLGENIADVAGLAAAYDAYKASQQGKEDKPLDGFSGDQRFFLGFAQAWRSKMREATMRNRLLTDVHAPAQYRALTVRNQDAWYPAFDVKEGQKLYLAPDKRVKVW
ncbi:M13 family metallopeptidase [Luteimonas aquatica]|uniref:M13 family metallopeptidase n=1 Tax=Luteimonas aquatica TaxID=450364 RepID=UPI001F56BC88|nr:M13 family metallopeptidase [Luteimonas aquatica]